jgi:hypothetical protein
MSGMRINLAVAKSALVVEWTFTSRGCMLLHDGFDALPCVEELEKLPRCFNSLQLCWHSYASILEWVPASLSNLMEFEEFKYYGSALPGFFRLIVPKTPFFEPILDNGSVSEEEEQWNESYEVMMPNSGRCP